jgi:hypothetical protein
MDILVVSVGLLHEVAAKSSARAVSLFVVFMLILGLLVYSRRGAEFAELYYLPQISLKSQYLQVFVSVVLVNGSLGFNNFSVTNRPIYSSDLAI